ncbi:SDR family NAD(P)-dependent oxidoreductase [Micromonospora musae]|uniref:SDR family NAD(P)-dependent oxidoreductase n=1 Tax=Micromonospora musae TaxID=1894970 RepID=UPI00342603A4
MSICVQRQGRKIMKRSTWLVTGASSGLGLALSEYVLGQGDRVVLTGRNMHPMRQVAHNYPGAAHVVPLDVTNAQERRHAVQQAEFRFGGVDILVNNAGIDFIGAIEEQEEKDYRAIYEVNLFGPIELLRLVLPGMRRRRQGTVVNISSMNGFASVAGNGFYSSSKFALEGLTEALRQEIEPIGLRAFVVQPGSFRTGIEARTRASGVGIEDYVATAGMFRDMASKVTPDWFPGDPARAAKAIYEAVKSERTPPWLILGSDAHRTIGAKLDQLKSVHKESEELASRTDYPTSESATR